MKDSANSVSVWTLICDFSTLTFCPSLTFVQCALFRCLLAHQSRISQKALHKKDKRVFTIQEYKKKMPASHTNSQHKRYGHQKATPVVVINRI